MNTKITQFPPAIEWDFRNVSDSALEKATLYEYARTSNTLRNSIQECLQTKIKGWLVVEHILSAFKTSKPFGDSFPNGVLKNIYDKMLFATKNNLALVELIVRLRPDFPAPWTVYQINFKAEPNRQRVRLRPASWIFEILKEWAIREGREEITLQDLELHRQVYQNDFHCLDISWNGATVEQIVRDFEKSLRAEARKHPEMKKPGKAGQRPYAPLAWLAAYRINKAGVTYDAAQMKLEREGINERHTPRYSDKSAWSDAVKKASQILTKLEAGHF